jgi:hypothetical protein
MVIPMPEATSKISVGIMLITARDRVEKLKSAGKSVQESVAEKPFADLDPVWGKGVVNGDQFAQIVYLTL